MNPELVVRSKRVVTLAGVAPHCVVIYNGKIAAVGRWDASVPGVPCIDAVDAVVLPGFVDAHVHINEPGRADWEGFETATRAAAAGGITTLIEMPLNAIPATTSVKGLKAKIAAAEGKLAVDTGFWGGVVPGNTKELAPLWKAGVFGFKCFLVPSGVDEFPCVGEADLERAMPILTKLGAPLLVHAEVPGPIEEAAELEACIDWDPRRYSCYLESRPHAAETEAIAMVLRLQKKHGTRVHIVHLSAADALPQIAAAKLADAPLTVETCPHYLTFAAEEIADGATQFKCAPPIREAANREQLWAALRDGLIDAVMSDHSPCPPAMKRLEDGDFLRAWGGVASLQLGVPAVWTGLRARGGGLGDLESWMASGPSRVAGLWGRKGVIDTGYDADLVIFRPEDEFTVTETMLHHRHKLTPYLGRRLSGVVETTILRGSVVYDRGAVSGAPRGQVLRREAP